MSDDERLSDAERRKDHDDEMEDGEEDDERLDDEDDEENEEDEEDEEEEEETERARKKRRRRVNRFIEEEAAVGDDEEEDDDDEDDYGFDKEELFDEDAGRAFLDTSRHRDLDRRREEELELNAEEIAERMRERYGSSARGGYTGDTDYVPQSMLIPGNRDPKLWMVKCKPGKEKDVLFSIMHRFTDRQYSPRPLQILSAFVRDGLSGYIYIESTAQAFVSDAIDKILNVMPSSAKIVPVSEMVDTLTIKSKEINVKPGAWVRVKKGTYAGDLAQVLEVLDSGDLVTVKLVPRIDSTGSSQRPIGADKKTDKKRKKAESRPPPKLLTTEQKRQMRRDHRSHGRYLLGGEKFDKEGYLEKDVKISSLDTEGINPTLEEITRFSGGAVTEHGNDLVMLAGNSVANADDFQKGESVEVISGDLIGTPGTVQSVENGLVTIMADPSFNLKQSFQVEASALRKRFSQGDQVKVINGVHKDQTGMIIMIQDNIVNLLSDSSQQPIQVFSKDLRSSTQVSTARPVMSQYDVKDLVHLSPTEVGVVLKVELDSITVLTQFGTVQRVKPASIRGKRDSKRAITNDSVGHPISAGEGVQIIDPQHPEARKRGTVLHIYRTSVFVQSPEVTENDGIFVTRPSLLTSLAARNGVGRGYGGYQQPYVQRGGFGGGPRGGGMGRGRGRDPLLSKTVVITSGPYKGYLGIVKDIRDTLARVELHTAARTVSVERNRLQVPGEAGTANRNNDVAFDRWQGGMTPAL
ncbi:transcription elongation factor spt5, partial [Borealophlyctis nickersoniae]